MLVYASLPNGINTRNYTRSWKPSPICTRNQSHEKITALDGLVTNGHLGNRQSSNSKPWPSWFSPAGQTTGFFICRGSGGLSLVLVYGASLSLTSPFTAWTQPLVSLGWNTYYRLLCGLCPDVILQGVVWKPHCSIHSAAMLSWLVPMRGVEGQEHFALPCELMWSNFSTKKTVVRVFLRGNGCNLGDSRFTWLGQAHAMLAEY